MSSYLQDRVDVEKYSVVKINVMFKVRTKNNIINNGIRGVDLGRQFL